MRVFERDPELGWREEAESTAPGLRVGVIVDLRGDRLATTHYSSVGTPRIAGVVYERGLLGNPNNWDLAGTVEAPDWRFRDSFGQRIALDDGRVFVTAPNDSDGVRGAGSIYVFKK